MSKFATKQAREFYAQTYDTVVPDWPGQLGFYRELAAEAFAKDQAMLELAYGTGRVTILTAREGGQIVGFDRVGTGLCNSHSIE